MSKPCWMCGEPTCPVNGRPSFYCPTCSKMMVLKRSAPGTEDETEAGYDAGLE
jgi:hypothetical protein